MKLFSLVPLVGLLVSSAFAPSANAGDFELRLGSHGRKGSIGISIGTSHGRDHWDRDHSRSRRHESREWIPGRMETIRERVWIEGCEERTWIEPRFELRYDSRGRAYKACTRPGHWQVQRAPGRYEWRERKVFVEGGWRVRSCD